MAEYRFEASPAHAPGSGLKVEITRPGSINRYVDREKDVATYNETATGQIAIVKMSDIEVEVIKRGLFAPFQKSLWTQEFREAFLTPTEEEQVAKLAELETGISTSGATLRRSGSLNLSRRLQLIKGPNLAEPRIQSYAGNLAAVRSVMLGGVQEEYLRDGQANEGHFVEVATVAERMRHEILEEVTDPLVAVHGLSLTILQQRIDAQFANA